MNFSQDDFLALGRQLVDQAIADYQAALVAHATTVDTPAPQAHPVIEAIVQQAGGRYTVLQPQPGSTDLGTRLQAVETTAGLRNRLVILENALSLTPAQGATMADRVAAIEAAAAAKFS